MFSRQILRRGLHTCNRALRADAVAAADSTTAVKSTGSWAEMSSTEKVAAYRSRYPHSRVELLKQGGGDVSTGKLVLGTLISIGVAYVMYSGMHSRADPLPHTITPEWEAATKAKMIARNANPMTGYSSAKNNPDA